VNDLFRTGGIIPDTSVILKWYLHEQEPERAHALALLEAYLEGQIQLLVPDLLPYEAANVLRYKPGWDAARVSQAVSSLFALRLNVASVTPLLLQRAVVLACRHGVAVYDAAFVALAEETRTVFVTADEKLVHRLEGVPLIKSLREVDLILNGPAKD
jgi:predicted nucleic acid-binding protein